MNIDSRNKHFIWLGLAALHIGLVRPAVSATWLVGPQYNIKQPSQVAKQAKDGDIILIAAGTYSGDVAVWPQNNLTLRGINGQAQLQADGRSAENKAIWVFRGNNVQVENIVFSGAAVPDLNGAGIRFEGKNLTLRHCHFHHNQMGILTGANAESDILIEGSEFNDNTVDYPRYGKLGHNIYIGAIRRFTLSHSYVHDAESGHNVKSRARENYLLYNRIMDERTASSYLVDLAEGGQAYVIGNQLRQSPEAENATLLSFAAEHGQNQPGQALYLINNTLINDRSSGLFVNNHSIANAVLHNNLLVGQNSHIEGSYTLQNTLITSTPYFENRASFDYRLTSKSDAIDRGVSPGYAQNGDSLLPLYEYQHPLQLRDRPIAGAIDIGAIEYSPFARR